MNGIGFCTHLSAMFNQKRNHFGLIIQLMIEKYAAHYISRNDNKKATTQI